MTPKNLALVLIRTLAVLIAFIGVVELLVYPFVLLFDPVSKESLMSGASFQYLKSGGFYTIVGLVLLLLSKKLAAVVAKPCTAETEKKTEA